MDEKISLYIMDDHPVIRESLKEYFTAKKLFHVLGANANADGVLDSFAENPPDVLILDVDIPGENSFEFA